MLDQPKQDASQQPRRARPAPLSATNLTSAYDSQPLSQVALDVNEELKQFQPKKPFTMIQKIVSCLDPSRGLIKAFVSKGKIKLFRVTNHAHTNFQFPIDVLVEDPQHPLTQHQRIQTKEIKQNDRFGTYSKVIKTVEQIQQSVLSMEGLMLKKDLCVEFAEDINRNLWLLNAYSKEYADFAGLAQDENDYNEKYFLKVMEER